MSNSNHPLLTRLHLLALLLCVVFQYYPREKQPFGEQFTQQCLYDTHQLCPDCFLGPSHTDCEAFRQHLHSVEGGDELYDQLTCRMDRHGVRYGQLAGSSNKVVLKNLNKDGGVEVLRDSVCRELEIAHEDCKLSNDSRFMASLRRLSLDRDLIEGAVLCPAGDEEALDRLLSNFEGTDLLKLVLMRVNVQPLLLKMFSRQNFSVPSFIFQGGFTLVESYDGETLSNFYSSPLKTRLKIAKQLISAILTFEKGVDSFKFYLTDLNPENIAVQLLSEDEVKVSFIDLNNVIILDSQSQKLDRNNRKYVHSRIDCDGCFAYVQEDLCSFRSSDINLFAICQLFLENLNSNRKEGFLYGIDANPELENVQRLLHHCVYCVPPNCDDRQKILLNTQIEIENFIRS